jgi:Phage integrase family
VTSGGEAELVFGRNDGSPFDSDALARRARRREGLAPIGLHECRHTYAAFLIAAGVNAKAVSAYMGHSSITVTLDRYGHLMPGNEDEAAAMLAAYLEREAAQGVQATRLGNDRRRKGGNPSVPTSEFHIQRQPGFQRGHRRRRGPSTYADYAPIQRGLRTARRRGSSHALGTPLARFPRSSRRPTSKRIGRVRKHDGLGPRPA